MKEKIFKSAAAAMLVMASLMPSATMAAEFRADESGTVSVNEAVGGDLYAAGGSIVLGSEIDGDATLGGGNLLITGYVDGDILAGGGNISVLGDVADDVRVFGGNITVNGNIEGDVIAVGGQINITSSAVVGGDLVVIGGMAVIDGSVEGNVTVYGNEATINGPIGGSVKAKVGKLVMGQETTINGRLVYSSDKELLIAAGTVKGGVEYTKLEPRLEKNAKGALAGFITIALIVKLISLIVVALILSAVFKKRTAALVQRAFTGFGWNVLRGFAAMVLIPIAAVIMLITIIGLPLGFLAISVYGALLVLGGILAPILVGSLLWKLARKSSDYPVNAWSIITGSLIFLLAGLIPIIGWLFDLIFMFAALGVLTRVTSDGIKQASA